MSPGAQDRGLFAPRRDSAPAIKLVSWAPLDVQVSGGELGVFLD
jgi:hypothetical protein